MKNLNLLVLMGYLVPLFVWAGPGHGGGGDSCEERFKDVARDLKKWILAGGPSRLELEKDNPPIRLDDYTKKMVEKIDAARISCVSEGDRGYPVEINGHAKECKNFVDDAGVPRIICDRKKYYLSLPDRENDPSQYRVAHHEYATLAGFEIPKEDDSDYHISDRITGFLENKVILRLAIKSPQSTETSFVKIGNEAYTKVSYGIYHQVIGVPPGKELLVCRVNGSTRVHIFESPQFWSKFDKEKELSRLQLSLEDAYWDLAARALPDEKSMRKLAEWLRKLPPEQKFDCLRAGSRKQLYRQIDFVVKQIQKYLKVSESYKAIPNYDDGDFCTPMNSERLNPYLFGLNVGVFESEENPYCLQNYPRP